MQLPPPGKLTGNIERGTSDGGTGSPLLHKIL